jgi:hypothetical protein
VRRTPEELFVNTAAVARKDVIAGLAALVPPSRRTAASMAAIDSLLAGMGFVLNWFCRARPGDNPRSTGRRIRPPPDLVFRAQSR